MSETHYPIVINYTTYHCGMCRAIVSAICRSHPTAKVVSVENYTDGRPPSNPWNGKFLTVSRTHDIAAAITYQRAVDVQKERNGHTVCGTTEVVEKSPGKGSKVQGEDTKSSNGEGARKRGRQKGAKKCFKCQRFHVGECNKSK